MKQEISGIKVSDTVVVQPLEKDSQYEFLGILDNVRQEEKRTLECAKRHIYNTTIVSNLV